MHKPPRAKDSFTNFLHYKITPGVVLMFAKHGLLTGTVKFFEILKPKKVLFYLKMKSVFRLVLNNAFMKLKISQQHYLKIFEFELKLNFGHFVFLVSRDNFVKMLSVQ